MNNEEDIIRIEESKECDSCIGWLKYCNSECCRLVFININPLLIPEAGKYLSIRNPMEHVWYHRLRGVKYERGMLRFPLKNVVTLGTKVAYVQDCDLLDGKGLCKGHPDKKPELCKVLTIETANRSDLGFEITDNCLFKYKLLEKKQNG